MKTFLFVGLACLVALIAAKPPQNKECFENRPKVVQKTRFLL